uniref:Large ribosomal subunit protein uL29c n=9 Tax=Laminariaceae TaxID=33636 RepID=A0A8K1SSA5_9PHAE|nr:50S ribosomal protein L29 [Saccharina japonica]YP_009865345.1 50S ribosomal protein L29 [Saccharina latissima]YP_010688160.1 50S ribosomal protein L29 [Saccharina longissima]YP_010863409.1 50S ribosomal protein L29 [Saccharina japonica x Saccharina latissima]YP_011005722.1 50S ribosomal protein L29 [Cymathaere triplicata]YP_011006706.1 50S ribosomal protein L29 [Hedophyllum nigripes]QOV02289.1 50S ribosomal protein L29 [Saccharina sp. ye-B]QWK42297.1 ribosomal protein L29 [Postelsia palma
MSLPKIDEIKNLDKNELENEILNIKKQLFKLRLRRGAKQSFKSHQFKHGKHRLAQLLMIQKSN